MCVCVCLCARAHVWAHVHAHIIAQFCLTLCNAMDGGPPGSSVHGNFQARILEWVAYPFSRGSSQPRNETGFPALQADSVLSEPLGKLGTILSAIN